MPPVIMGDQYGPEKKIIAFNTLKKLVVHAARINDNGICPVLPAQNITVAEAK